MGVRTRKIKSLEEITKEEPNPVMAGKALNHFFSHMKNRLEIGEIEQKIPYFGRLLLKDENGRVIKQNSHRNGVDRLRRKRTPSSKPGT